MFFSNQQWMVDLKKECNDEQVALLFIGLIFFPDGEKPIWTCLDEHNLSHEHLFECFDALSISLRSR